MAICVTLETISDDRGDKLITKNGTPLNQLLIYRHPEGSIRYRFRLRFPNHQTAT